MSENPQAPDNRHENPSGLPDDHPSKVEQPVAEKHHEEGHVDAEPDQEAQS